MLLSCLSENDLVARLAALLPPPPAVPCGIGDDCAVLPPLSVGFELVLKSDPVVEGVHFLAGEVPARIGHKALARVLSDFAAMGARPRWALVNVQVPADRTVEWLEDVYRGLAALCRRCRVHVVGGDVTRAPVFALNVFVTGEVAIGTALTRSAAKPGDLLAVTGCLGNSLAGHHLDFLPRLAEGSLLRAKGGVRAAMDLSDGLAADLPRLCAASGVGAVVETARLPLRAGADAAGAWRDGEDYELLFTVAPDRLAELTALWPATLAPLTVIGRITAEPGIQVQDEHGTLRALDLSGFDHFQTSRPD